MGLFNWFSTNTAEPFTEPKRTNHYSLFNIQKSFEANDHIVLMLKYLGAKNYKGNKILVFKKTDWEKLRSETNEVDPHFIENKISPVARFEPTEEGFNLAKRFIQNL